MIRELWSILDEMKEKPDDWGDPYFSQERYYDPAPLSRDNLSGFEKEPLDDIICCVDGGNNKIYESPSDSLHLIRIYFNLFKGRKRVSNVDPVSIYLRSSYGEGGVNCTLYPLNEPMPFEKREFELEMKELEERKPVNAGHTIRKYLEWEMIRYAIEDHLGPGDIVVKDGCLQTGVERERVYAENAYASAEDNGVFMLGIAKTCSLLTSKGHPLIAAVMDTARRTHIDRWYYHPIAKNSNPDHKGEMYIVKYHPSSDYAFRTEFYREQCIPDEKVLSGLAYQASDPTFLGYPYGLVDADKKARVTDEEIKYLRGLGENRMDNVLKDRFNTQNAHDRLSDL